jgi:hypothetical protein
MTTMKKILCVVLWLVLAMLAEAGITIGQGPWIGTDKRGTAWYEEFQDWKASDLRALDTNGDTYNYSDTVDMSRDIVAFYSRIEGDTVFFRVDFFDLAQNAQNLGLDLYVAIDCAAGGAEWMPDFTDTRTDTPWELCVAVYDANNASVYNRNYQSLAWAWKGSYWRADLDSVEFGISRFALTDMGWNGTSPLRFQVFTTRDGTNGGSGEIGGSDIVDSLGTLFRTMGTSGNGYLQGSVSSDATTSRAKYAAVAHANQSVATQSGTQNHIFTNRKDVNLYPGFVRALDSAEMLKVPMNLHISGTLLMSFLWAEQDPAQPGFPERDGPTFINRVRNFVKGGPGSIIGGTLAEHIMPYFEGDVNRKSIEQNNLLLQDMFGLTKEDIKVMHVPERVIRSDVNHPAVRPEGPLDGKTFEDIEASGFKATYLDEVTHLHHWFYGNEQNNPGWDDHAWGRWSGGQGNDEETYQHKVHKINGVYCFVINDREDQAKFGNDDGGMSRDTRYTLLQKAMGDYAQLTLVFDDWEAYAGNSFASATPNNNADQWHTTLRWAANHPWIEIVNLKDVATWAMGDPAWVIDHGYVYNKSSQTYEWLKHASEGSYDTWYYGSGLEENFYNRVPRVINDWAPEGMKKYGDMNSPGTLIRDSWDVIQQITSPALKMISEWSYSAMIYETAWHDENPPAWWPPADKPWLSWADAYQSRNYQFTFQRPEANSYEDAAPLDWTSSWAVRLHGHVRDMGVMKDASDWIAAIKSGAQTSETRAYARDIDDDRLDEYVLCNDKVYLCFERWGGRLVKAFVYDAAYNGGDARMVIGVPICNPAQESENEDADNNRCSAFKDRYSGGTKDHRYVDMDFASPTAPRSVSNGWVFVSQDGKITKRVTLPAGKRAVLADYQFAPELGMVFTRHGLGPNQLDLMLRGQQNLVWVNEAGYRGLRNSQGGEAYVVAVKNAKIMDGKLSSAGWDNRELPLVEQFETYNTSTSSTVAIAFDEATARELAGAPSVPVQWVGNTYHWPFNGSFTAADDLWVNTESWPKGAGVQGIVVFSTNRVTWSAVALARNGSTANNDQWHANLGKFKPGQTVEYAVAIIDAAGTYMWDSRGGQNYKASVSPALSVQWIGNTYTWPGSGQVVSTNDLWINTETWPNGAGVTTRIVYTTNGTTWAQADLRKAGTNGNNDWWHLNMGKLPAGTTVRFAMSVEDANGKLVWDKNGGRDYTVTVR